MRSTSDIAGPEIFRFLDYRAFLRAYHSHRRGLDKTFSYRRLAKYIGFKSPDYLSMILDGRRNLPVKNAVDLARLCGLKGREAKYFLALVQFNQSRDAIERELCWAKVVEFAPVRTHVLADERVRIFHHWFVIALYESLTLASFCNDPKWIAAKFRHRITPKDAALGLSILRDAGLIADRDGRWQRSEGNLFAGGVPSEVLRAYHARMLDLAKQSLIDVPFDRRTFTNTVMSIPRSRYAEFRERVEDFQAAMMQLATRDSGATADSIYQLSVQLFPLTSEDTDL